MARWYYNGNMVLYGVIQGLLPSIVIHSNWWYYRICMWIQSEHGGDIVSRGEKTATKLVPGIGHHSWEACSPSLRSGRPKMAVPFWRILQNATKDQGRKPAKLCKNAVQWWSMNIFHVKVTWIGFQFILMGNHARVKWNSWNGEFDQK
jgi:hypothetical protein